MRKTREAPPDKGSAIPAIALTTYRRAENRLRALSAGFHKHGANRSSLMSWRWSF